VLAAPAAAAAMLVLGLLGARPAPILGLDGDVLQASVGNSRLVGLGRPCDRAAAGVWACERWDNQSSGTVAYRVEADWKGCWRAVRLGSPGEGSRKRLSGCVTLVDYVF
jgi:hypothetical protein